MPVDGRRALSTWREFDCEHRLPSKCIAYVYFNNDRENNPFTSLGSGPKLYFLKTLLPLESDILIPSKHKAHLWV
jgi:hypothetical protein